VTPEIARQLIEIVTDWARHAEDVRAVALVGSWARGEARADSDLDLVVLAIEPQAYQGERLPLPELAGFRVAERRQVRYGVVTSQVLTLEPPAEMELTFADLTWARTDPVDLGTASVVRGGFKVLIDKDGLLGRLAAVFGERDDRGL